MKKILLSIVIIFLITNSNFAQVTDKEKDLKTISKDTTNGWNKGGMFALTFGQSSFTNWASGGTDNLTINGISSLFANYKQGKLTWNNTLDLGYGLQRLGSGNNSTDQKTDDKIDIASKLGYKANNKLYYAFLVNFKTQFSEGLDYTTTPNDLISDFLSPGYLLIAAGIDYRPNKEISVFFAPATSKTTFVSNQTLADAGAFGVDLGKNTKSEFGGYLKATYNKEVMKNVNLKTKLGLFSNYLDKPENIDIDWEVLIGMKVNKYLTVNINTQLLYDDDVKVAIDKDGDGINDGTGSRIQFKEILGIGFSVNF